MMNNYNYQPLHRRILDKTRSLITRENTEVNLEEIQQVEIENQ